MRECDPPIAAPLSRRSFTALVTVLICGGRSGRAWCQDTNAKLFFISSFGARGNGQVDDNAAFEECCDAAAKNAGWVVLDKNATYVVGKAAGFTIKAGLKGVLFKDAILKINPTIRYTASVLTIAAENCIFQGLNIDADGQAMQKYEVPTILYIVGKHVTILNATLRGRAQHFILGAGGADGLKIKNAHIATTGPTTAAIYIGDSYRKTTREVKISNVRIEGSFPGDRSQVTGHSIALYQCESSEVSASSVFGGGETGFGISFNRCNACIAIDNFGVDTTREFINATACDKVTVESNRCFWTPDDRGARFGRDFGISIEGSSNTKITNNKITGAFKSGIASAADSGNSFGNFVSNNVIVDCACSNAEPNAGLLTYCSFDFANVRNTYEYNTITNSPARHTKYDYYEISYGSGEVGYNRIRSSKKIKPRPSVLQSTSTLTFQNRSEPNS